MRKRIVWWPSPSGSGLGRRGAVMVLVGVMLGAPGCSVLFGTDSYRAEPDVPTAPEVSILPAQPTTLDELTVTVDVDATDPLGEAVTYRYEWLRDDSASSVTGAQVPASETSKHETWTVRVIPVAGGRDGVAGTASVTIVNSLPVVQFARLARYEVWQDEAISASAVVTDADGDPTTLVYSWANNDVALTANTSTVDASSLQPGDEVTVTISAMDDDGDASVDSRSAGPAVVRAPQGWRQLEPNRGYTATTPLFFADLPRGRMLFLREGALWEFRVTGTTAVQWAKLNLPALPELFGSSVVYDAARSRYLIWGGVDYTAVPAVPTSALYELGVGTPGQETFRQVSTTVAPPTRIAHVTLNDVTRSRAIILGGGTPDALPINYTVLHDDVWALDYSTVDPTFQQLPGDAATPPATMMGHTVDTLGGDGYLFGGFAQGGTALDGVFRYDFATDELTQVGTLTSPRGSVGAIDVGDGTALLLDGSDALINLTPTPSVQRFTYATRASSAPLTLTGTRPAPQVRPFLERDGDTIYWASGELSNDLFVATVRQLDAQPLLAPHDDAPGATSNATIVRGAGAAANVTFAFGTIRRDLDRAISGSTYSFDGERWSLVAALSDPTLARTGASPVVEPRSLPDRVFGSSDMSSYNANSSVLTSTSGAWAVHRADEPALHMGLGDTPTPAWRCNDTTRVLLEARTYELSNPTTSVAIPITGTPAPSVRGATYEALRPASDTDIIMVFGGSPAGDWYTADVCATGDDWTAQAVAGGPSPRYVPSITKRLNLVDDTITSQVFVFGGATALGQPRTYLGGFWLMTMDAAGVLTAQALSSGAGPTPSPRSMAVLGWDRFRHRVILFGGEGPGGHEFPTGSSGVVRADTWEYRLMTGL